MVIFYLKKIEYCLLSSICAIGRAQLPSFMNMPKERQKTLCSDFENILMTAAEWLFDSRVLLIWFIFNKRLAGKFFLTLYETAYLFIV
jgi:hypothetical protein